MNIDDLYSAFADLGAVPYEGLVFRHVSPHFDCHSAEGARIVGGRWNPPNSFAALYTALTVETAAAELKRLAENQHRPLVKLLPRKICEMRVAAEAVLDLRDRAALARVCLTMEELASAETTRCRIIGDSAYKFGLEAVLAPSATRIGDVLVVFPLNLAPNSRVETRGVTWWRSLADLPR